MTKDNLVLFTNWTEEDFEITYDSVPYVFKAGESTYLEIGIAKLFAKHLVDRELNKQNLSTANPIREEMEQKCITIGGPVEAPEQPEATGEQAPGEASQTSDETSDKTKEGEKTEEDDFEGLKEGEQGEEAGEKEGEDAKTDQTGEPEATGEQAPESETVVDFETMPYQELIKFAKGKGIKARPGMSKQEIIEALNNLVSE